jgi:hypothetical protein
MGRTVAELEETMAFSEFLEWQEYLTQVPSTQEVQMAHLLYIQAVKAGSKNVDLEDFLIAKAKNSRKSRGLTAEQINKIAGVR